MKGWIERHGLSIVLAAMTIATTMLSYFSEHGEWHSDFWMEAAGGLLVLLVIVLLKKRFYEVGSDGG